MRPTDKVLPEFVYYLVRQDAFRQEAKEHMTGSVGQARVPVGFLREYEVLLPPVAEQREIVDKVKALLAEVNAARERLATVPKILKSFRQSVLTAACSGRMTEEWRMTHQSNAPQRLPAESRATALYNIETSLSQSDMDELELEELPNSWTWTRVERIADVALGGTPSRKEPAYWNGHIRWVSSGEVANCRIALTREMITERGLRESNAKIYPPGTVLIAMIGEGKTRGQSAILDVEACTNQNVAGLLVDATVATSAYVWYWARAQYEGNRASGRGGNQPALNGQKVRRLPFPLPPIQEQTEIVRRVEELFALADTIESHVAEATARTDRITQAILAKAFRGELTTACNTNPSIT